MKIVEVFRILRLRIGLILTALCVCFGAYAQEDATPVRWRTLVKMSSPTEGEIVVRCLISEGWHVYGFQMPSGGPKATKIDFGASEGISLTGEPKVSPEATEVDDPMFGMRLSQWSGNFELRERFRLTGPRSDAKVSVKITYMSCYNTNCRPPKTETFTARIPSYDKQEKK